VRSSEKECSTAHVPHEKEGMSHRNVNPANSSHLRCARVCVRARHGKGLRAA
jgi:hypothetical protein